MVKWNSPESVKKRILPKCPQQIFQPRPKPCECPVWILGISLCRIFQFPSPGEFGEFKEGSLETAKFPNFLFYINYKGSPWVIFKDSSFMGNQLKFFIQRLWILSILKDFTFPIQRILKYLWIQMSPDWSCTVLVHNRACYGKNHIIGVSQSL